MKRFDAIVLGGGIIGCAVADALTRRGARTAIVERGAIGCEASTAAAGILASQMDVERPGPFLDLCQAARRMYPAWVKRIERRARISAGYHRDGMLYLALTDAEARRMQRRCDWQATRSLPSERWSPREVTRREPHVTGKIRAGFFFPTEGQIDNVKLMDALAAACRVQGVTILDQTDAQRLVIRNRQVAGVQTNHGTYAAPVVVNCLGSWAGLDGVLPKLPVEPCRGQIVAFRAPKGMLRSAVMAEVAYGVQRRDGKLLVGSTLEFAGYDRRVTLDGMRKILSGFQRIVKPEVLEACTFEEAWAGLRPCSQDQLPILGASRVKGLYVAAGHFRHGILLAPMTGKLLAELILDGRSSLDLSPFSPDRF